MSLVKHVVFDGANSGVLQAQNTRENRPDFSAAMLRLMLRGRVQNLMIEVGLSRKDAEAKLCRSIKADTGLLVRDIRPALRGACRNSDLRTRLWCALGMDPGADGYRLTDDGGQAVL